MLAARDVEAALVPGSDAHAPQESLNLREARARFEREFILSVLTAHDWRIRDTAESLGINRSYLWKKMQVLNIETRGGDGLDG